MTKQDIVTIKKVYRSKVDGWLLIVIIFVVITSLFGSIEIVRSGMNVESLLPVVGLGIVLPVWLLLGTRYVVSATELIVRTGPFRWRIPLAEITNAIPTRNPLSSPALSIDRLRIEYGRGKFVMISPRDKEQFVQDIKERSSLARTSNTRFNDLS